jgi:uncharacterized protein YciI
MNAHRAVVLALCLAACATQSTSTPAAVAPPNAAAANPRPAEPEPPATPTPPAAPTPVAATTPPAAPKQPHVYWAVRMLPGPAWVAGKPADEQPGIDAHVENLEKLNGRGLVFAAGPFIDGAGGMTVLRVKSAKEAQAIADDDPCVKSGVLKPEVHPWLCVFRSGD